MTKQTRYLESFQGSGYTHYTEEYRKTEIFYKFKGLLTFYVFYHFISKSVTKSPPSMRIKFFKNLI